MSISHTVYVVRHARAGSRSSWDGTDDRLRPLNGRGQRQALALATILSPLVKTVHSSPYLRCVETVAPLATIIGADVDILDSLSEGESWRDALSLIKATSGPTVFCTHGDVLGDLINALQEQGVTISGYGVEKACTWSLTVSKGGVASARYSPPPEA